MLFAIPAAETEVQTANESKGVVDDNELLVMSLIIISLIALLDNLGSGWRHTQ